MTSNTERHHFAIDRGSREAQKKHASFVIWFTGLSGSGKSTIANAVEKRLFELGVNTYVLDGDNVRQGLNSDLSFKEEDRDENIRRIAEVANLFIDAGIVVLASFISPYKKNREEVKRIVGGDNYVEVYVSTSLKECERRDVKGLYKKVRKGEIDLFTGISSPYERPVFPAVEIDTDKTSVEDAVELILEKIQTNLKMA